MWCVFVVVVVVVVLCVVFVCVVLGGSPARRISNKENSSIV